MKIVAFTGMPFSGKSEAVAIARDRGYSVIRMGDLVWEETKHQGLDLTDINVGKVATEMRRIQGKDIWARKTLEKLQNYDKSDIIIIDGIRNVEEVTYFTKNLSKDFMLVSIQTDEILRYRRAQKRGRIDDALSINQIRERDQREKGWGIHTVIDMADQHIINNSNLIEFRAKINAFFSSLEKR